MEWIPVSEKKPTIGERIIVHMSNGWEAFASYYRVYSDWIATERVDLWKNDCGEKLSHVTHWMPLPEPPE